MHGIEVGNKQTQKPQPGDIYIGRPSPLGNPFVLGRDGDRATVIAKYRRWLTAQRAAGPGNAAFDELTRLVALAQQRPLRLMCFCKPLACHGDVIAELLRELGAA